MQMNLLFDLDGTLTDPFVGITGALRFALEAMGRPAPPPERLRWCIGPPLRDSLKQLLNTHNGETVERALALYRQRFRSVGLFQNRVYDGIPGALHGLQRKGYTLYVATAKPQPFADRIIDHFGLRPHFKAVYGCELDGRRGEKSDLIAHLLLRESLSAARSAMIGDRIFDMRGAADNGLSAYGVLWGYGSRAELEGAGAIHCFKRPTDLPTVFQ